MTKKCQYECRYCPRSFPTARGRNIHEASCRKKRDGFGGFVEGIVYGSGR